MCLVSPRKQEAPPQIKRKYIIRDEPFGYTLFNRESLSHRYLLKAELTPLLLSEEIDCKECKVLTADVSCSPKNIPYSPIRIYFEITSQCNLRCKICFNRSGKAKLNELSTKDIVNALKRLSADNVIEVRFCGGEPTLRQEWYSIVRYAQELGFSTSINTSGVYTHHDKTIHKLSSLNLDQIAVSIDGDRKYHDYLRGNGTFEKAIRTIKQLHSEGARIRVNTILTRGSLRNFSFILDTVAEHIEEINFFYLRPVGRAEKMPGEMLSYKDLYAFDKSVSLLIKDYPNVRILHGCKVMLNNSIDQNIGEKFGLSVGGPDGFTRLNLLADGAVWPGGYTPHITPQYYLGNILEQNYSILNIWRHSPILNSFREKSGEIKNRCFACPEKNVRCPGACLEMELYRETAQSKTNPYCKF
jgi:MoaA/NifB/PqqE/SkfB family radical SAM enzyme